MLVLERHQVAALAEQVFAKRPWRVQHLFQARGAGRIEINTQVVGDQAERRCAAGAQSGGTQKSVFQRPIGNATLCREPPGPVCTRAIAPARDGLCGIGGTKAEADASSFRQKRVQMRHLADDPMGEHVDPPGRWKPVMAHFATRYPSSRKT